MAWRRKTNNLKMLPSSPGAEVASPSEVTRAIGVISTPSRQLADLPKDELDHLAEEFGLDPRAYRTRQELVAAIHARRQLIATMDREAMLDVIRWGRRPVTSTVTKELLAQEIVRVRSMRFAGLSQRGLAILAQLRGIAVEAGDDVPALIHKLKKQEGFLARLNRKRRAVLGKIVSNIVGEAEPGQTYQFLPGDGAAAPINTTPGTAPAATQSATSSIKEDIEESGLFGGIANRVKKTADQYLNQKLDEIEARIDRKLDEIDRRLAEWRDKEIANRIRILKITLWASVIVGLCSLIYSYVKVNFFPRAQPTTDVRQVTPAQPIPLKHVPDATVPVH